MQVWGTELRWKDKKKKNTVLLTWKWNSPNTKSKNQWQTTKGKSEHDLLINFPKLAKIDKKRLFE